MFRIEYLDKTNGAWIHIKWIKKHNKAVKCSEELNIKGCDTRVIHNGIIVHKGAHD